ncbi:FAD-binding domain-containing protein [Xylariaceae sp. FL1272]|nr:FAD-binding domain-containing protein [Xylariaceae sp. FL1272]
MSSNDVVAALQAVFPQAQILFPGSDDYHDRNESYLAKQLSDMTPSCIFQPKNTGEVTKFVQIVKPFALNGSQFAIRGCGNMPLVGLLNEIQLDNGRIFIGAGATWGAVNKVVHASGLGVVGGRSGTGGIGGLALSGGLSVFSSREGFICDNITEFEVVTASGEVIIASNHTNVDLFVALRGGLNNFGIVTRFVMSTFELGHFWGGNVLYFPSSFPNQIEALVAESEKSNADPNTHLMISIGYSSKMMGGVTACMNTVYYTKDVEHTPAVLEPFSNITPQIPQPGVPKRLDLLQMAASQAAGVTNQVRCLYMNITVKPDVATLQTASDIYTRNVEQVKSCGGLVCSLTLQPYPVSMLQSSVRKGGNSLGLDPSTAAVSVLLLTYWDDEKDDQVIRNTMRSTLEQIRAMAVENRTALDFIYLNYAADFQDPIVSYGAENKKKLQNVSRKYDPKGLFQKGVSGGFKLF